MGRRYHDSVEVCGQLVRGTSAAILKILSKSDKPLTVPEIGNMLSEFCSIFCEDNQLYAIMRLLTPLSELVTTTEIESAIRGHTQKRTAWEATPAVKEFFLRQEVTQ